MLFLTKINSAANLKITTTKKAQQEQLKAEEKRLSLLQATLKEREQNLQKREQQFQKYEETLQTKVCLLFTTVRIWISC